MELRFKKINNQSTSGLVNWLKGFKEIQPSLLLEVDLGEQSFIAKCFPPEKSIVKYSKITFADAGFELTSINDNDGNAITDWANSYGNKFESAGRIKIGIYEILSKFIDVVSMFSEVDHTMTIKFDICNDVKYIQDPTKKTYTEYQGETIQLKSVSLTMNIKCSVINEFFYKCDDDTFMNVVCFIKESIKFALTSETIANLIKISSVFTVNKSRDTIKFYSKQENDKWALYAYDETNGAYDYLLGYYTEGDMCETSTVIFRENFINATKGINGEISITLDTKNSSRMLIDSHASKIVVAAVQNR